MSGERVAPRVLGTLGAILVVHLCLSVVGIRWGLPSRANDRFLFGEESSWTGDTIHLLSKAQQKFSTPRGADVDADPLARAAGEAAPLTSSDEDVAKVLLRYRLYTHQPDEMITMMALRSMRPSEWDFDPKLYQYGGLFIYPVGAFIKLGGLLGLLDVRSDVAYYLDHPDEFGKFYVIARMYSALWGAIGVLVVFAIGRRLGGGNGDCHESMTLPPANMPALGAGMPPGRAGMPPNSGCTAGLLAAALFPILPVVACMAHEAKPHLGGAVMMLLAVLLAMRCVAERSRKRFFLMSATCGGAMGMVLSSWPIFVLIPLVGWMLTWKQKQRGESGLNGTAERSSSEVTLARGAIRSSSVELDSSLAGARGSLGQVAPARTLMLTLFGLGTAVAIYVATNPYVVVNLLWHREVLASNFQNSFAMYDLGRLGEGFLRVAELTAEGASPPVVAIGVLAAVFAVLRRRWGAVPLLVPAVIFFVQFACIGAGKPAEYGRFGVFTNAALVIGAACALCCGVDASRVRRQRIAAVLVAGWMGVHTWAYVWNFHVDQTAAASRSMAGEALATELAEFPAYERARIAVSAEPAPYVCPPLPFARVDLVLYRSRQEVIRAIADGDAVDFIVVAADEPAAEVSRWMTACAGARTKDGAGIGAHATVFGRSFRLSPISWANKPMVLIRPRVFASDESAELGGEED